MKVTVRIPDTLLIQAKDLTRRDGTTLAALVVEGLRRVVKARSAHAGRFELRDASFGGKGVRPEFAAGWDAMKAALYEGRGG
jgi:hypothetical protein